MTMKTENRCVLVENGMMARQQRPLTAKERTISTPSLEKATFIGHRPLTSLRRHRACSASIQDRNSTWRGTDTCSPQPKLIPHRYCHHLARTTSNDRSGGSKQGQRSKYVPYSAAVFKSLQSDDTPETTSSRSEAEVKLDMSCGELPPIRNRTGSAKSRKSSRDSSSGGGHPVKGSVIRYEKAPLLSANSQTLLEGVPTGTGRAATKRTHMSGQSNGSSSPSQQSTNPGQQCSQKSHNSQLSRAKSWCATESRTEQSARLETLFEKNGMISGSKDRKSTTQVGADRNKPPRARMRGQAAQTTSSMAVGVRSLSNSVSNLSKTSDTNTSRTAKQVNVLTSYRNRTALQNAHKFKSEQNLTSLGVAKRRPEVRSSLMGKVQPTGSIQGKRTTTNNNNNNKPSVLRSIQSQPQIHGSASGTADDILTPQNLKSIDSQLDDSGSDSDYERNQRIHDWLLGTENAELPDNPEVIVEEKPKQTDTAIHIVYDKD